MEATIEMLMEMQKQNQFHISTAIGNQHKQFMENDKNFKSLSKKLKTELDDFKLSSSNVISPSNVLSP